MTSPFKIVLANGCFDIFHIGHLRYLEAASEMGNRLVVAVTRNAHVNKGPGRPLYDEKERADIVRSLRCVNEVILTDSSIDALTKVMPHVFAKGREYEGRMLPEDIEYCRVYGVEIRFTETEAIRPQARYARLVKG